MKKSTVFVTLFDSHYLSRGLVLYESLINVMHDFILYIIAFDNKVYAKLRECNLRNVVLISLEEFEDEDLLKIKGSRSQKEYCWTCSSKSIKYVIEHFGVDECTYIDADIMFFDNPRKLIDELQTNQDEVLITEHRYSDYCDQTYSSGKYCVQFLTIKNQEKGMKVLNWWVDRCLEWCFARTEAGKFGDQMYLNSFSTLFDGVHVLQDIGGGVAPWNVDQNTYREYDGKVYLKTKETQEEMPVVFYHFEAMTFFDKDVVKLSDAMYHIPDTAISCLYKRYIRMMEYVCRKYFLLEEKSIWKCEKNFRDDDMDCLDHSKLYYNYSLFV